MSWLDISLGDTTELDKIVSGIRGFKTIMDGPELASRMVPAVASVWADNFRNNGYLVGGWASLSAQTLRIREKRRQLGSTLRATDALYGGAVDQFLQWRTGQTQSNMIIAATTPDIPEAPSGPTSIVASMTRRQFKATMTGPKAMHQTGGEMDFFGSEGITTYLPARPFWFFNQAGLDKAGQNVVTYLINIGFYGMPNFQGITRSVANANGPSNYANPAGRGMWTGRR